MSGVDVAICYIMKYWLVRSSGAKTRFALFAGRRILLEETPMLTLHHLNDSRSQRILWLLEELGVPY
jgi:hypothetical protein